MALAAKNADIATAAALVVYTATVNAALDTTVSLPIRQNATAALVALNAQYLATSAVALSVATANFVSNGNTSISGAVTALNVVQVRRVHLGSHPGKFAHRSFKACIVVAVLVVSMYVGRIHRDSSWCGRSNHRP